MAEITVDLPVTNARIVYDDGTPDAFVSTLADEITTDEIVLVVTGGATHIYPVNWDSGPTSTVVLPTPPSGYTLTDAHYVAKAYRESDTGGTTPSFGFDPDPDNAPYLLANTSDSFTIDYLPLSGYGAVVVGRGSEDLSLLAGAGPSNFNGDAWTVGNIVGTTAGVIHVAYMALRLVYTSDAAGLPCDTDVAMDLSTASFMGASNGGPFGEYGDSVIFGGGGGGVGYPDFFFASFVLDATKRYRVTITYNPSSGHDSGGRRFWLSTAPPGDEESVETLAGFPVGNLWDAGPNGQFGDGSHENTADTVTVTIGPGRNGWDDATYGVAAGYSRLWFETDTDGAVSAITVRQVCKTVPPPLRMYPRPGDMFASSARVWPTPHTIQASNRRGPSAIL